MAREKIPKIVGKLRYLCKDYPEHRVSLINSANLLLQTIHSLNAQPARWPTLVRYRESARLIEKLTGEAWRGE